MNRTQTQKATLISERGLYFYAGDDLRSHTLSRAVPSALRGLTSVFGMGTGGSPAVRSPTNSAVSYQPSAKNPAKANLPIERR